MFSGFRAPSRRPSGAGGPGDRRRCRRRGTRDPRTLSAYSAILAQCTSKPVLGSSEVKVKTL
jgi:hypothetical protein